MNSKKAKQIRAMLHARNIHFRDAKYGATRYNKPVPGKKGKFYTRITLSLAPGCGRKTYKDAKRAVYNA